jgi:hypothetical protein
LIKKLELDSNSNKFSLFNKELIEIGQFECFYDKKYCVNCLHKMKNQNIWKKSDVKECANYVCAILRDIIIKIIKIN